MKRLQSLLAELGNKVKKASQPEAPKNALEALGKPTASAVTLSTSEATTAPIRPYSGKLPKPTEELDVAKLSRHLTASLEVVLPTIAYRIYQTLHQTALEVACRKGYNLNASYIVFHIPAEVVAHELGIDRTTLWRHLKVLTAKGLIDYRAHKTTIDGMKRNDGTLWAIKLNPTRGKRAKLCYEDFKHPWRDLAADIRAGRTAFRLMQQSKPLGVNVVEAVTKLLTWALPHKTAQTPLQVTVAVTPELMLDLASLRKQERGSMVDKIARGISQYLGDHDSLSFYRWLLWQLLRLHDRGQNYFSTVHLAIRRAGADRQEGFARKAGALLISRLKEGGLWNLLRSTPTHRVGEVPTAA